MKKLPFPPSTVKLDRKSGKAGQALQLGVAWNLRFGAPTCLEERVLS